MTFHRTLISLCEKRTRVIRPEGAFGVGKMSVLGFLRREKAEGQAGQAGNGEAGHSFGEKLHAWWEGYELPAKAAEVQPAAADAAAPAGDAPAPDAWSKSRIKVAEL